MESIKKGSKFVACWGYDQTQYSIYNVVDTKGKSVFVEGLNGWSGLSESDLAVGSKVKVFKFRDWYQLTDEERADFESCNFDHNSYNHHMRKDAEESAEVKTIVKMSRINGESWSYLWTLDDGQVVSSKDTYSDNLRIKIVHGYKKCLVKEGYNGTPQIKLNESIRASLDPSYDENVARYKEQNEYTAYNGR